MEELHDSPSGLPTSWKFLQKADGWIERHVSNGQDSAGRAYARLDKTDRRWDVLVSHKSQQDRDIDRILRY